MAREVLDCHVRLSRQSGGLAPHRGGSSCAWRRRDPLARRGPRHRQHLLGDRDGGSGGAADHPPYRARESQREDRRHGLLRDALRRRGRGAPRRRPRRAQRRQARSVPGAMRASLQASSRPSGMAMGRAGRPSNPGSRGGRRSRFARRPAAKSGAPTASSRRPAARRGACRSRIWCARSRASAAAGFKEVTLTGVHLGSYGRDLPPRVVAARPAARARRDRRATSPSGSARSSRWTARRRSSTLVARQRPIPAALPPAAPARERPDARVDAAALHARRVPPAGRRHRVAPAARVDRRPT